MRGRRPVRRASPWRPGCPVIPVAHWGAQDLLYPYAKRPHLFPPTVSTPRSGDPVDLDDLRGEPITTRCCAQATDRIMAAITALLEDIRGEQAPAERFDPKAAGVKEIGNPHRPSNVIDAGGRR